MNALVVATATLVSVAAVPYLAYIILYGWLQPSGSPVQKKPREPTVSILLPTYNEERIIEQKLVSLCELDYPAEKIEVVVADSSDDGTATIVRDFFTDRDAPALTLLEEGERRGVARAINDAMKKVSGEVVFRTDCDSRLAGDAVREAVANLADPDVAAVTGRQVEVLGDSEVEEDYRDLIARLQSVESRLDSTFICHGPCFAFERAAFRPIAPDSLADDTEIGVSIRRGGDRVVMDPATRFIESGVSAFGERRTRKDRRAMGLIQLLARNRDLLGRAGRYGRIILPFNWWFMIVSPWLCVAVTALATAAAVNLLGLIGLALPILAGLFLWLGQRDALGPLQPLHAVADAQISLLIAQVRLVTGDTSGTWTVDRDSREAFE